MPQVHAGAGYGSKAMEIPPTAKCANQLWIYDGGFIKSRYNGHVIDVKGASRDKGTQAIVYPFKGGKNQQWEFTPEGYIRSSFNGLVLDIPGGKVHEKAEIQLWDHKGAPHQQWTWDEYGFITSRADPQYCLDFNRETQHLIIYKKWPVTK